MGAMFCVFAALARSVLECGIFIRSPHQIGYIQRIRQLQDRILKIGGVRMEFGYGLVPLGWLEVTLGLEFPSRIRQLLDVLFVRKVLAGEVDCNELFSLFFLRTPGQMRSSGLFCRQACSIQRLHRLGKLVTSVRDILCGSGYFVGTVLRRLK